MDHWMVLQYWAWQCPNLPRARRLAHTSSAAHIVSLPVVAGGNSVFSDIDYLEHMGDRVGAAILREKLSRASAIDSGIADGW